MKMRDDKGEIFSAELPIPARYRKKIVKSKPVNVEDGVKEREKK